MKNLIFNALLKKAEALAVLSTYLNYSVRIGEHPQIVEEYHSKNKKVKMKLLSFINLSKKQI